MLEKPIEKALYDGTIPKTSNFIAITEGVLDKIGIEAELFSELKNVQIDIKDSEGNSKVNNFDMGIFYREF